MQGRYILTYEAWPFAAPVGRQQEYLEAIGDRRQTMEFRNCSGFDHAYQRAKDFMAGVKRNTRVWEVKIVSLEYLGEL